MSDRQYIKLQVRGDLPAIIYVDQISSVISLGILGTKIVTKELNAGKNVEYVFAIDFEAVMEKIQKTEQINGYKHKQHTVQSTTLLE